MLEPLRILIADDEAPARERLRRLLVKEPEAEIVGLCGDGIEAVEAIGRERPNLLFLDVQMPRCDGFGVVNAIGAPNMPLTVFVTAYDDYAIRAFETGAVDYLVKPFSDERFATTMQRARRWVESGEATAFARRLALVTAAMENAQGPPSRKTLDRLVIKNGGRVTLLPVAEIDWIGAAGPYAEIHVGPRTHVLRISLSELEERLDPRTFQRVHRSTIVNLDRVSELQEYFRGEYVVVLNEGTKLKLSRGRRAALEARLGQSL